MSIICKLFGHSPSKGYHGDPGDGYCRMEYRATDGLNTVHASLHSECHRCGKEFQVGMLHVPEAAYDVFGWRRK